MERMMMQALATYEKRQGREIDEVEQHVFRTAYAMGVQDQQAGTAVEVCNLRDELRDMRELCEDLSSSVIGAACLAPHGNGAKAMLEETMERMKQRAMRKVGAGGTAHNAEITGSPKASPG